MQKLHKLHKVQITLLEMQGIGIIIQMEVIQMKIKFSDQEAVLGIISKF